MSIVPEDMISLILSQLPVKSLLRFKCVSKQFCSIIDSHYFSQLHLRNFVKNNTELSFIIQDNEKIRSLNFSSSLAWKTRELDAPFGFSKTKIFGSSNGLICVLKSARCRNNWWTFCKKLPRKHNISPKVALWNPSTSNKLHILPIDPIEVGGLKCSGYVYIQLAFGHDSVNNDYKVLRIVKVPTEFGGSITNFRVYSLKTNSWREIIAPRYAHDIMYANQNFRQHVLFREAFHWLLSEGHESNICAFDIQEEEFCIVPLPNLVSQDDIYLNLGVLGQCLCLASDNSLVLSIDIWMMKEYGMKDSWVKFFSLKRHLGGRIQFLEPLEAYPKDVNDGDHEKVLLKFELANYGEILMWYDIKKEYPEIVTVPGPNKASKLYAHVGSLVSPFFNDGSKTNDQVHQECETKTTNKKKRKRDEIAKNSH